jgi:hypothetical protein
MPSAKNSPGQLVIYATVVLSIFCIFFATLFNRVDAVILGLGVSLIAYGVDLSNGYVLLLGSIATFLCAYLPFGQSTGVLIQGFNEGFADADDGESTGEGEGFADGDDAESADEGEGFADGESESGDEGFADGEGEAKEAETEPVATAPVPVLAETFANPAKKKLKKKLAPPPDNGSRAEMFELGKQYKMPKESDDPDYHLDAGTTFLNAYKSLKPDQISAMTKDTQDLINTQKQLMSTLNTLKPLITDGKQMIDTFQGYFGGGGGAGGGAPGLGDLSKMAEQFAPK